jgi:hypothetical protein
MSWAYNAISHRQKALSLDWCALTWRAPNGHDWEAALEAPSGDVRQVSHVVFQSNASEATSGSASTADEAVITRSAIKKHDRLVLLCHFVHLAVQHQRCVSISLGGRAVRPSRDRWMSCGSVMAKKSPQRGKKW